MEIDTILQLNDSSFCLRQTSDGPTLRTDHSYYAQCQGEMAIMGLPWCDFVLWTAAERNNIFIERVLFNCDFVKDMMPALVEFYVNKVLPNIVKI